jgi:hypothetical protein
LETTSFASIVTETVLYSTVWLVALLWINSTTRRKPITATVHHSQLVDYVLSAIHLGVLLQTLLYKISTLKVIYIVSPCHMVLLAQAILLILPPTPTTRRITIWVALLMLGSAMAMVVPDTETLTQPFEVAMFWLEHVLIVFIAPLRIYYRHLNMPWTWRELAEGLVVCQLLHMPGWMAIAYFSHVNVEFMLCPSNGLAALLATQSQMLAFIDSIGLSYRTVIIIGYIIPGMLFGALHLSVGSLLARTQHQKVN